MRKHGKYARRRAAKPVALLLAVTLVIGCAIGGTVAWLTHKSGEVVNTFTPSDVAVTLTETKENFKMVPGWTIEKDPKATVADNSEDCWLFVKITESATLDSYIAYAYDESAWEVVQAETDGVTVLGRKVYKGADVKEFNILVAGSYKDEMGTEDNDSDDVTISWSDNHVGVKPSVTKQMMNALNATGATQPKLTFKAYATQLYKTNSSTADSEFTAQEAWNLVKD